MLEPDDVIESKPVYEGRILKMRVDTIRLPDGKTGTREIVEHRGAVAIVPLIDPQTVIMVRQYRSAARQVLLEIPAGTREVDEDEDTCARRELAEETNYQATHLIKLFQSYVAPGYSSELIHVYLAYGISYADGTPDDDEFVEVEKVPLADVPDMIARGDIQDGKSIGGLLATIQMLPKLQF
jgi:ADP-ribose pyrophosphatase